LHIAVRIARAAAWLRQRRSSALLEHVLRHGDGGDRVGPAREILGAAHAFTGRGVPERSRNVPRVIEQDPAHLFDGFGMVLERMAGLDDQLRLDAGQVGAALGDDTVAAVLDRAPVARNTTRLTKGNGVTNAIRRSRWRVSGDTSSVSIGRLKARSQNFEPLSIAVILVRSPP
jgi:hypothetical protein